VFFCFTLLLMLFGYPISTDQNYVSLRSNFHDVILNDEQALSDFRLIPSKAILPYEKEEQAEPQQNSA
jgi:hypothetical protein